MSNENDRVNFCSSLDAAKLVDARQTSGRLTPVFPALMSGSDREEEYVARMVRRDRELNWG